MNGRVKGMLGSKNMMIQQWAQILGLGFLLVFLANCSGDQQQEEVVQQELGQDQEEEMAEEESQGQEEMAEEEVIEEAVAPDGIEVEYEYFDQRGNRFSSAGILLWELETEHSED
jgi:hypothetical protein